MKIKRNGITVCNVRESENMVEAVLNYIHDTYKITPMCAEALIDILKERDGKRKFDIDVNDYAFYDVDKNGNDRIYILPGNVDENGDEARKWCIDILSYVDNANWSIED